MIWMTLGEVCSRATQLIQGRTDITLSDASFWANKAYEEIATRIRYRAEESLAVSSTTSGENRFTLPSDFGYPISLSNLSVQAGASYRVLRQADADTFDSESTALGVPEKYALYNGWVELWPSPDSSYSLQLRYGAKLPSLISSSATPALDEKYHLPWVFRTASLLAASVNDLEGEATNLARYLNAMGSTPSNQAFAQRDKQSMRVSLPRTW